MNCRLPLSLCVALCSLFAAAAETSIGWRGDGTGCYPGTQPPVEWSRKSKGIARTLLTQAKKPVGESLENAKPMRDGAIRQWLGIGPFSAGDAALDHEQIPGEDQLQPDEGEKVGERAWKSINIIGDKDEANSYNTTALNWVNLRAVLNVNPGELGYAHAYVYAQEPGTVKAIVDHMQGLKVRVNGKPVYTNPGGQVAYWGANNDVYWLKTFTPVPRSATFQFNLVKGWNRLLFKCVHSPDNCQFNVRITDPLPSEYETKNIVWTTTLPGFANAMPVIVGDKVFVTSEPDELVCINKQDGRILWKKSYGHYETLTDDDRKAHPIITEKIDPLAKLLSQTEDPDRKMGLRKQIRDLLLTIDKEKYAQQIVKHQPIVGYCTPTPCSDGKFIYTISGNGVAACFDLDGNPAWITYAHPQFKSRAGGWESHGYPASPVLIDNKFIFHLCYLVALDAKTGKEIWRADTDGGHPSPDVINESLWAAKVGATPVVGTPYGLFYNATNGQQIWQALSKQFLTAPRLCRFDNAPFFLLRGTSIQTMPDSTLKDVSTEIGAAHGITLDIGGMILSSPLYHDGLMYAVSSLGNLAVADASTGKQLYEKKLDLEPFLFWNGAGVCASLALAGNNIYVMDNRGHTIVFKPGRQFEQLARNTIEDNFPRRIPDDAQELTQSTPAFEGTRIYIRGEENLYCIGEK
jgi:outer membrane protein assembly factor BamB